ncbi:MAG: hypothetical protein UY03_C0003G0007 [Parcubacteria group bacterium GW2011_GWA2_47_64]|nr:MAG: hypothetical protein UY03_C0003G0007 [Parcubacteria group bacterium GW2011_GWA2_47_64]KKU96794.1 MAG: hypothetical protein UY29_C0006G0003 [Parcubacteria group bacterium GW2011_GWC2_48_17]
MSTKILLGFLIVALIAPTVFFAYPQKAEAVVPLSLAQCGIAKITAKIGAAISSITSFGQKVPTVASKTDSAVATSAAGMDWVQCFMKGLVKILAKTLLHTFVQSIVNWINTGFQGSPSFVTNPEGFLNDVADQTIGRIIEDIDPLLCSPFRLDIRFALGLNLSLRNRQEIHCRLSDVIANVRGAYDGFVTGTVGSGNLSRWIHIAGTQQNNPYGAYMAASYDIGAGITSATGQQIKLLDWGKGFKSWRSCKRWGPKVKDESERVIRNGPCLEEGEIKTPGSVIVDQANESLKKTLTELEVAQELDEVFGALVNQLLYQVMRAGGGLLGASKGSTSGDYGGRSVADLLETNPEEVMRVSTVKVPDGINCRLRYYPATKETALGSGIYVPDESNTEVGTQVWTDNLGAGKTVGVATGDDRSLVPAKYLKEGDEEEISVKRAGGDTWAKYFAGVRTGCKNAFSALVDKTSTDGRTTYIADAKGKECMGDEVGEAKKTCIPPEPQEPPQETPEMREIPLAGMAGLNQSHINYDSGGNIVHGPLNAAGGSSLSDTEDGIVPHWWTASFAKKEEIEIIQIRFMPGYLVESLIVANIPPVNGVNTMAGIPITRDDVAGSAIYTYPGATSSTGASAASSGTPESLTITFTPPVTGNAIAIISDPGELKLSSVKLYRPAKAADAVTPTTAPPPVTIELPTL